MGADAHENPPVKLYIAPFSGTRDVAKGGLPSGCEKVRDSCSWDRVPEDVRDEFRQQAQNLADAMEVFGEQPDDDDGDESDGDAETEDEETVEA